MDEITELNRAYYDRLTAGQESYWKLMPAPRMRIERVVAAIRSAKPTVAHLCDFGCGNGDLLACRTALIGSLQAAIAAVDDPNTPLYPAPQASCPFSDRQICNDAISFTTVGAVSVPDMEWINRPTWQQVVEVQGHRVR